MNIVAIVGAAILCAGFSMYVLNACIRYEIIGFKILLACIITGFLLFYGGLLFDMSERTCPSCEAYYKADAKYCDQCGTSLISASSGLYDETAMG